MGVPSGTEANAANPIRRVVTMLQDMHVKVTAEGEKETVLFDKFMCYCKTAGGDLEASITAGKAKIASLEELLKTGKAKMEQLEADLKEHEASRTEAKAAMAEATALREKEAAAFTKFADCGSQQPQKVHHGTGRGFRRNTPRSVGIPVWIGGICTTEWPNYWHFEADG